MTETTLTPKQKGSIRGFPRSTSKLYIGDPWRVSPNLRRTLSSLDRRGLIRVKDKHIKLTKKGRVVYKELKKKETTKKRKK